MGEPTEGCGQLSSVCIRMFLLRMLRPGRGHAKGTVDVLKETPDLAYKPAAAVPNGQESGRHDFQVTGTPGRPEDR